MKEESKGIVSLHIAVLLFGTAGLFGKVLDLSPIVIVYGRVAFAALFLGVCIFSSLLKKDSVQGSGKKLIMTPYHLILILLLGIILSIHWITFFHSIQLSTVAIGLLSFSTFPIFVVFLEPLFLKTSFKVRYLYFALIIIIGIWFLVPEFNWQNRYFQGVIWGCISGLLFAFLTIINKYLSGNYKAINLAFFQNSIAFVILLPLALPLMKGGVSVKEWTILILLGVFFTAVSHSLFIYSLKTIKARIAGLIACMEPVYGIVFALIILAEIPHPRTILGGTIILATVVYLSRFAAKDKADY